MGDNVLVSCLLILLIMQYVGPDTTFFLTPPAPAAAPALKTNLDLRLELLFTGGILSRGANKLPSWIGELNWYRDAVHLGILRVGR